MSREHWRTLSRSERLNHLWRAWRLHLQRRWQWWVLTVIPVVLFQGFFMLSFNVLTDSLPHAAYLVFKLDREPVRGGYYAFHFIGAGPYPRDAPFVKEFAGVPGDVVAVVDREVFVNDRSVGVAKELTKTGFPLQPIEAGAIPAGQYYVHAPNPDSLDSRYAMVGLISKTRVIGRAIPLW